MIFQADFADKEELSLSELADRIKDVVVDNFPETYWVRAETSDVRVNSSGHCYLELVEKNERNGQLSTKMRASIWASSFFKVKYSFEHATGERFASGIKVLVNVKLDYHELYGFSLNIVDIDPNYTVGDMLRKRNEIIRRLQEDGVFTMNKELFIAETPNRIAIISSPTAAGYGDFVKQLENNPAAYAFHHKLFPAIMQGEKTEASIITALEHIFNNFELFDVVVIIRGGGAASELSAFDSYDLAAHCAQFPLPILSGIGHDRDESIVDLVACKSLKTPTAVAEFLVNRMDAAATILKQIQQNILLFSNNLLQQERKSLQSHTARIPSIVLKRIDSEKIMLAVIKNRLPKITVSMNRRNILFVNAQASIVLNAGKLIAAQQHFLQLTEQLIQMASPDYNLKRGYTLTLKNGKIVKRAADLSPGDEITTRFVDGNITSRTE